jgi:integrase
MASAGLYHGLQSVTGLHQGRSEARETKPVGPVSDAIVEKTLAHLRPAVAAMVQLQRLAGMRPGEVVAMRSCDLNTAGDIWEYHPDSHKTAHHGKDRVIFFGSQAQAILRDWIKTDLGAFLFSPRESMADRAVELRDRRKTPCYPSHMAAQKRKRTKTPIKAPRDFYDVASYRRAIARACDAAFPHPALASIPEKGLTDDQRAELAAWRNRHRWHPHQLRHSAATPIRRKFGLEAAQAVLGHSQIGATQVYAEKSLDAARDVMRAIG